MKTKYILVIGLLLFLLPVGVAVADEVVIDDFEDGTADGWQNTNAVQIDPIEGDWHGEVIAGSAGSDGKLDFSGNDVGADNYTHWVNPNRNSTITRLNTGSSWLHEVRFRPDLAGEGEVGIMLDNDEDTGIDVPDDEWYRIHTENIDEGSATFDIYIYDADGNELYSELNRDYSFTDGDNQVDAVEVFPVNDGEHVWVDYVTRGGEGVPNELQEGIIGTVTDEDGNPIEGANVTATTVLEDTRTVSETTTDANGEFLIQEDLTTAEYTVFSIKSPEYWPNFVTVSHTAGTTTDAGTIEMESRGPGFTGAYPRLGVFEQNRTTGAFNYTFTLKQPISDDGTDTATVDVYWKNDTTGDFESITQDTVTETDGSVSFDFQNPNEANPSLNEWFISVDLDRGTFNSSTYQYLTPGNITLVNASTDQQITDSEITATFRSIDSDFETTKTTTSTGESSWDGVIDMNDIPREDYIVTLESTGGNSYDTRSYVVSDGSVTSLLTAGLVNSSTFTNEPEWYSQSFELEDNTGQWNPRNVFLLLEQRVDGEYQAVTGDIFGVQNEVDLAVNDTENYRMTLLHSVRGDERNVGVFNADRDDAGETVTITVDSTAPPPDENDEGYKVSAELLNATDESIPAVFRVTYNDPEEDTVDFNFTIYERDNPSNIVIEDVGSDQLGSAVFTIQNDSVLPDQTWIVDWQATRDGEHINGTIIVGPDRQTTDLPIPDHVKHGVSFIVLVLTAGLVGGRAGSENGAIVLAIVGGILWYIDFMPTVVGAGVVTFALFVAILFNAKVDGRSP